MILIEAILLVAIGIVIGYTAANWNTLRGA